jgi:hypothetical protein
MEMADDILCANRLGNRQPMNYNNYEVRIVEKYGVELVGWPCERGICNPGSVGGHC